MRPPLPTALTAALLTAMLPLAAQAGSAEVRFNDPDAYTDAGRGREAESTRQVLASHLEALAQQRLPAGQQLTIVISDIDLAGEVPPMLSARIGDVRVLGRSVDWPRITLSYTLRDGAQVLAQGSDVVADMAYLQHGARLQDQSALPYERRMLSDWFERRFAAARMAPG